MMYTKTYTHVTCFLSVPVFVFNSPLKCKRKLSIKLTRQNLPFIFQNTLFIKPNTSIHHLNFHMRLNQFKDHNFFMK